MSSVFRNILKKFFKMKIIENIIKLMKEKNINDATLCRECNLNHSSLYDWRSGRAKPTAEAIIKIAQYFKVSADFILGLTDDKTVYY